jgi:4-amino-4-deoxy-L-arabinose transferase-like glycosyltransferase
VVDAILSFHRKFGYVVIVLNALAGLYALAAWRWARLRSRWVWIATIVAEAAILVQIVAGTIVVANNKELAKQNGIRFHMFYGFVAFLTIGIAYQYRSSMRGRLQMFYGIVGLFLMGVGIRAVMQVV